MIGWSPAALLAAVLEPHPARWLAMCLVVVSSQTAVSQVGAQEVHPEGLAQLLQASSEKLVWDAEARLMLAQAAPASGVMLVIAADDGATADVVHALNSLGGRVRYRQDRVGYVRALMPLKAVSRLLDSAPIIAAEFDLAPFCADYSCPSMGTNDVDQRSGDDLLQEDVFAQVRRAQLVNWPALTWQQGTWNEDPFNRPYDPLVDLGASAWRNSQSTYDGRGVVIGQVESRFDLLAPEFSAAITIYGEPAPKVVDYRTTDLPDESLEDPSGRGRRSPWVPTIDVETVGQRFAHGGHSFTAPYDGRFRFGYFDGGQLLCRLLFDARFIDSNRFREDAALPSCRFGVLWDPITGEVWLDADRDGDFSNERGMRDYHVRHDVGVLGHDDPRTRAREALSVAVQTDSATRRVAMLVSAGGHATMVAGSAVASPGSAGHVVGVAPGAQILLFDSGLRSKGQSLEGIIAAFLDPRVDLVFAENNFAFRYSRRGWGGGPTAYNGRKVTTVIIDRLINLTGKPFVAPAGNSLNDADVELPAVGVPWSFAVGASEGRESWWINQGMLVAHDQNLHPASNFGPGDDGSIQPTILAPSGWLTVERARNDVRGYHVYQEGLYQLPPGYVIGGGTSQATPTFAGALALLISAAKQERVPYDWKRLWLAVTNSARFAPHIPAYQQGNGFVNIEAAFELLKQYATRPPIVTITSRGPVRTNWSRDLIPPHEGVSLFEREGWSVGMQETRTVTLTRTTGPAGAMRFALSWQGNDGTFVTQSTVSLPLNRPVPLEIRVAPRTPGYHSALLNLDHPSIPGHAHRLMTAVVAAEQFNKTDHSMTVRDTVERPGPMASYFLKVPDGVAALDVQFRGDEGNQFLLGTPHEANVWDVPCGGSCSIQLPEPGVWRLAHYLFWPANKKGVDLRWANPGDTVDPPVPLEFNARLIGVDANIAEARAIGTHNTWRITANLKNNFAAFRGALTSAAIGSGRNDRGHLAQLRQRVYDISVPTGAELLVVALPRVSITGSVDMFLLDCTGDSCFQHGEAEEVELRHGTRGPGSTRGPTKERVIRVAAPKAGHWRVVLDATHAPPEGVDYEYRDIVLDPALGGVISTDEIRERPVGTHWDANVLIWRSDAPLPEGRVPYISLIVEAVMSNGERMPAGVLVKDLAELTSQSEP